MSKPYIFPAWLSAKSDLLVKVHEAEPRDVARVIDEWFKWNVTEVGSSMQVSRMVKDRIADENFMKSEERRAVMRIVDKLQELGMYDREVWTSPIGDDHYSYRILVFNGGVRR